ncbi:NUDIX hydrolase [Geomicrobium sp. JCM 19039]|uniref:NUDIX hydrolase n=1 Tax=Geomicrobium sp. JCM 19039 TaxID=1460636 RepID=UPI0005AA22EB|nr:NUDIX hydrolase [Geomicrobium sp. JCM 19039]
MIRVNVVYALIYNEEESKVLMVNNIGGEWSLPGGAVDEEETLEQALIREVKEETNLKIYAGDVIAVNEAKFKEKGHHALFITFKAKIIEGTISIINKEEISNIEWVDIKRADQLMPYHPTGVVGCLQHPHHMYIRIHRRVVSD